MMTPLLLGILVHGLHSDIQVSNQPLPLNSNKAEEHVSDAEGTNATLKVSCRDGNTPVTYMAFVTQEDGARIDGSGKGLYSDGRFAVEGSFTVKVKPGLTKLLVTAGPDYAPFTVTSELKAGKQTELNISLRKWFSPEARGWYGGDNHVHAAHDQSGEIHTDLPYAALQARAVGLSFVTQASNEFPFEDHERLSTPTFIMRRSLEDRQGSFASHLNSPGVELPDADRKATMHAAMPASETTEWVHAHNAAIIQTHTMVPAHQLHWMGAAEAYSYSIAGTPPDAMDIDGEASENLWFTVLNLGNKVSVSGSTDAALERTGSTPPGFRRVYVHADKFDYDSYVKGIRNGKTFATNAGPVFPFMTIDGHEVADTVRPGDKTLKLEIDNLYPIDRAELIHNGSVQTTFDVKGKTGTTNITAPLHDDADGWYACRIHDDHGNWAMTSPIYVRSAQPKPKPFSASAIFEIGNFTRLSVLKKEFMAHLIVTVSPGDPITKVELLKDSKPVESLTPSRGDQIVGGKTPVTETFGEYGQGWLWHPAPTKAFRVQADIFVDKTGWYQVKATTKSGRVTASDEIHFDHDNPRSNETSAASLFSEGVAVHHWGYGESLPLSNLDPNQDGWWYPDNTFFKMTTDFGGHDWSQVYGAKGREEATFRATGGLK